MSAENDRIEKKVLLRAPRERVWRALSDSKQFGTWFGLECGGPFVAKTKVTGRMATTQVDDDVAERQRPFAGAAVVLFVEELEPMRLLSFRWHPGVDADANDPDEPTTLVTFRLEDADGGVLLTVTETGFESLPPGRRAKAFAENEGGWRVQLQLITKYLARHA